MYNLYIHVCVYRGPNGLDDPVRPKNVYIVVCVCVYLSPSIAVIL